jgi:hypothetical protein
MTILICISILSFLLMSAMIGIRLSAIKGGKIIVMEQPTLFSSLQEKIDWLAVLFVLVCRETLKLASLYTLLFLKKIAYYLKMGSAKVEKRFAHVIDMVRGKGSIEKRGAVSFFLREITDHSDKIKTKN